MATQQIIYAGEKYTLTDDESNKHELSKVLGKVDGAQAPFLASFTTTSGPVSVLLGPGIPFVYLQGSGA